jgi:hypothetical protein
VAAGQPALSRAKQATEEANSDGRRRCAKKKRTRTLRSFTFRSGRHLVSTEPLDGFCSPPGRRAGEIFVFADRPPRTRLETALHEALHAEEPEMSERRVTRIAARLASFLWRLGWREDGA